MMSSLTDVILSAFSPLYLPSYRITLYMESLFMLNLYSVTINPIQIESVSFEGKYAAIRTLDSPNDELSCELKNDNDARYLAECFDYLLSMFSDPWRKPNPDDLKVVTLLMDYFCDHLGSGPEDLLHIVRNYHPRYPHPDPSSSSGAGLCVIRVGADNGNVTLNPRYIQGASSTQCAVDIKIKESDIPLRFETNAIRDAQRFKGHVERIIDIHNAPNPPTRDQIISLLSDKSELRQYLRPRSGSVLREVEELLSQGVRAKKVKDEEPLLVSLYAKR